MPSAEPITALSLPCSELGCLLQPVLKVGVVLASGGQGQTKVSLVGPPLVPSLQGPSCFLKDLLSLCYKESPAASHNIDDIRTESKQTALFLPENWHTVEDLFRALSLEASSRQKLPGLKSNIDKNKFASINFGVIIPCKSAAGGHQTGSGRSNTSGGVSHRRTNSRPAKHKGRDAGRGSGKKLSGSAGGDDGTGGDKNTPPPLPALVTATSDEGKKCCWFWLYDPITYHACSKISKQPHHLKSVHLPEHYPGGIPEELKAKSTWDDIWNYFFLPRKIGVPEITRRDQKLLAMARVWNDHLGSSSSALNQTEPHEPAQVSFDSMGLQDIQTLEGEWNLDNHGVLSPAHSYQQASSLQSIFSTSGLPRILHRSGAPSIDTTFASRDSDVSFHLFSDDDSIDVNRLDVPLPQLQRSFEPTKECRMLPDQDGVNGIMMDMMDTDTSIVNVANSHINAMLAVQAPFAPQRPPIKVLDSLTNETYDWHDRHSQSGFDFTNFYLAHFGTRSTGSSGTIEMRTLDALQNEYYHNFTSRAVGEGFILLTKVPVSLESTLLALGYEMPHPTRTSNFSNRG